jgi:hypothetical protein
MLPDDKAESAFRILAPRLEPPPPPLLPPPDSQFFIGVPFLTLRFVVGSCCAAGLRGAAERLSLADEGLGAGLGVSMLPGRLVCARSGWFKKIGSRRMIGTKFGETYLSRSSFAHL